MATTSRDHSHSRHSSDSLDKPGSHRDDPSSTQPAVSSAPETSGKDEAAPAPRYTDPESTILTGKKLAIVFVGILLNLLLIALDQTILATALPRIASDFNAFTLQGWVSSAFILGQSAFLLPFSQLLRIWPAKWCLLLFIVVFEAGSAICGAAPDVYVLIFGRALSGVGAAGAFTSMMQVMTQCTRLEDRPKLFGLFGAVFGISSVIGPLVGGALTDSGDDGWRWCFYINLPIGGIAFAAIAFLLKSAPPLGADLNDRSMKSLLRQTLHMDWVGCILVLGAVTSLVLGLNWGGVTKPWSDYSVIVSLVMAGVATILLIFWERYLGPAAMVPSIIFKNLSCVCICCFNFFIRFGMLILTYYLPIFYQAARDHSATKSGVDILGFMLGLVLAVIFSGQIVGRIGRYWPFLIGPPALLAIGCGLLYTVDSSTSTAKLVGYQILAGVGIGGAMQNGLFAMQSEFRSDFKHLAQATGMATFAQFLGGTVGLSVAESVFSGQLHNNLRKYAPGAPEDVIERTPLAIYGPNISEDLRQPTITAYTRTLRSVFIIGVPTAILLMIIALGINNMKLPSKAAPKKAADAEKGKEEEKQVEPLPTDPPAVISEKAGVPAAEV